MTSRLRISLVLNLMLLCLLLKSSGILHFISDRISFLSANTSTYSITSLEPGNHIMRSETLAALPNTTGYTVFFGDSLIDKEEWNELFSKPGILNRGISGDTIAGVKERVPQLAALKPRKIFLMCGINSLIAGVTPAQAYLQYKALVESLLHDCPDTSIYVMSVLPISFDNYKVAALNKSLQTLTQKRVVYIDIYSHLVASTGYLSSDLTQDGVHLNGNGYKIWATVVQPYL